MEIELDDLKQELETSRENSERQQQQIKHLRGENERLEKNSGQKEKGLSYILIFSHIFILLFPKYFFFLFIHLI